MKKLGSGRVAAACRLRAHMTAWHSGAGQCHGHHRLCGYPCRPPLLSSPITVLCAGPPAQKSCKESNVKSRGSHSLAWRMPGCAAHRQRPAGRAAQLRRRQLSGRGQLWPLLRRCSRAHHGRVHCPACATFLQWLSSGPARRRSWAAAPDPPPSNPCKQPPGIMWVCVLIV